MPYVARNKTGAIIAVFKDKNDCAHESLSPEDRELRTFLGQNSLVDKARDRMIGRTSFQQALRQSDADFVRVLDDLITVLLNKGMIVFTDLPADAQRKLMVRRRLRDRARNLANLVGEGEDLGAS